MKEQESKQKIAVAYHRVASRRQADIQRSGEVQRQTCARLAAEVGATITDEYSDIGAPSRLAGCPGLQALLARISDQAAPKVDYVIVKDLTRLARNRADGCTLRAALRRCSAEFIAADEQASQASSATNQVAK